MIDSKIFGQWPWKNPHGENQSERETEFIISFRKNQTLIFTVKNPTYLNPEIWPADCLGFRAFAASISVQTFSENVPKISANLSLDFCAEEEKSALVFRA